MDNLLLTRDEVKRGGFYKPVYVPDSPREEDPCRK